MSKCFLSILVRVCVCGGERKNIRTLAAREHFSGFPRSTSSASPQSVVTARPPPPPPAPTPAAAAVDGVANEVGRLSICLHTTAAACTMCGRRLGSRAGRNSSKIFFWNSLSPQLPVLSGSRKISPHRGAALGGDANLSGQGISLLHADLAACLDVLHLKRSSSTFYLVFVAQHAREQRSAGRGFFSPA